MGTMSALVANTDPTSLVVKMWREWQNHQGTVKRIASEGNLRTHALIEARAMAVASRWAFATVLHAESQRAGFTGDVNWTFGVHLADDFNTLYRTRLLDEYREAQVPRIAALDVDPEVFCVWSGLLRNKCDCFEWDPEHEIGKRRGSTTSDFNTSVLQLRSRADAFTP